MHLGATVASGHYIAYVRASVDLNIEYSQCARSAAIMQQQHNGLEVSLTQQQPPPVSRQKGGLASSSSGGNSKKGGIMKYFTRNNDSSKNGGGSNPASSGTATNLQRISHMRMHAIPYAHQTH